MADLNVLRTILANGGADLPTLNAIRRLLDSGEVSNADLSQSRMSGSFGGATGDFDQPNAMRDVLTQAQAGPPADMPPAQPPVQNFAPPPSADAQARAVVQAQPSTEDLRKQGANFVRNEDTGQTIFLPPQGTPGASSAMPASAPAAPRMMQVTGYMGENRVQLKPELAPAQVNVDLSQPPLELVGGVKAYYSKDDPGVAYVMKDGQPVQKVILRDQTAQLAYNKEAAQLDQSQAATAHAQEETRASRVNNPDWLGLDSGGGTAAGAGGVPGSGAAGIDLSKVPPGILQQATAMANGDMALPMTRNGKLNPVAALAFQINPSLKQTDYVAKQQTTQDFSTKGKSGQVVQAINQALHHASTLSDAIDALHNTDILPGVINPIINTVGPKVDGKYTAPGNFNTAANALSEELKKIYAGGGGSLAELQNWQKSFDPNASITQQKAYLAQGMNLLQGAIQSRQEAYQRGMGPSADFGKLFDPPAIAALQKLQAKGYVNGGVAPAQTTAAPSSSGQVFQSLPNPAQFSGKRMQDDKGNTYRSDGTRWVRM